VDLAVDASSIINLYNARALATVSRLARCRLWLSPLVVGECEPTCAEEILRLKAANALRLIDSDSIPADLFLRLLHEHSLGEGETECIAVCLSGPFVLCCDDSRARAVAAARLGSERVIGSLRLLCWCVDEGILSSEAAFGFYRRMKAAGGFLPELTLEWFCQS
jgi:predicted nucleic acid-binding protein